jgi:gas vesicle protein
MRRLLDREALLRRAGLRTRAPVAGLFSGLALFSMGVLMGAGLGLLFAPRRGDEMRAAVGDALRRGKTSIPESLRELGMEAGHQPTAG